LDSAPFISLDADPGQIVRSIMGVKPPSQQLSSYVLATPEEVFKPLFAFAMRGNDFPYEREELIAFVRKNERQLRQGGLASLNDVGGVVAKQLDARREFGRIVDLIADFRRLIQLILDGQEETVDVRSETLMWLITILAQQIKGRHRDYADAVKYLARPEHRRRAGPATLRPMLTEFARGSGTPSQENVQKLYLILETALLCGDRATIVAGRDVLRGLTVNGAAAAIRDDLLHRCSSIDAGELDEASQSLVATVRKRTYRHVDDADL